MHWPIDYTILPEIAWAILSYEGNVVDISGGSLDRVIACLNGAVAKDAAKR